MAGTIRVHGYTETTRALYRVAAEAKATVYAGLREAAEPIAADARSRLSGYSGMKTSSIRPRVGVRGVYITQGAKKVTGKRPDFGGLQMTQGLIPAAYNRQDTMVSDVEAAFLLLSTREGF